jgi:hypothetical protein
MTSDARKRYHIVENFCNQAEQMRACYDEHFDKPFIRQGSSHQVWDYWHVANLYTYLRTDPKNILPAGLVQSFLNQLTEWSLEHLGLTYVSYPYLSLYVNGCGQGLHNDAKNGRWAYIYSLTNWSIRKFSGGETIVFHDENYWESEKIKDRAAGSSFYELIPARFNQLAVFDDRVIHAVQPIQGTMNPHEGRVMIHGHIRDGGVHVRGALSQEQVDNVLNYAMLALMSQLRKFGSQYHGFVSLRLEVNEDGSIEHIRLLTDRILKTAPHGAAPSELTQEILTFMEALHFPQSDGPSRITLPILFDE